MAGRLRPLRWQAPALAAVPGSGSYGKGGWIGDCTAGVRGQPIGSITLITHNAAGQAQRIVGNYRPRSTLLVVSRLVGERFAGTPIGEHFARPMMGQGAV